LGRGSGLGSWLGFGLELNSSCTERAIERATLVASTTMVPEAAVACSSSTWLGLRGRARARG
jgi:hypothetical protein